MVKALPAGVQPQGPPTLNRPPPNNPRLDPLTLFIPLQNPCPPRIVGKQAVYKSAMPPDQAFDTLIPCKAGFGCLSKHVCSRSRRSRRRRRQGGAMRAGQAGGGAGGEIRERSRHRQAPPHDEKEREREEKKRKDKSRHDALMDA